MADLNESLKIKNEILKQNIVFENNYKKIQQKIQNAGVFSLSNISLANLSAIIDSIPNGIILSNISYTGNKISFSATLPSKEIMKQMITNLNSLKFIKNINVPNVGKKSGNDQEIKADFIFDVV